MRRENFNKRKKYFNEVTMQRGYSVSFQVKQLLQGKDSWREGLTIHQISKQVRHSILVLARSLKEKNRLTIQKKKICEGTIYYAISQINKYSIPPFYIMSGMGYTDDGKKEWRYFVPRDVKDRDEEKDKLENRAQNVMIRTSSLNGFAENLEQEKELEELQVIAQKN